MDQPAPASIVHRKLEYLPVSLFGSVMGITGLSVAWRMAHTQYGTPLWIADVSASAAVIAFLVLAVSYALKWWSAADAVRAEFQHPIAGSLFGTVFISLLLLPIVIAPRSLPTAQALWVLGALGMAGFAWWTVSRWMSERQQPAHASPAWIIPVVGVLDVPLALPYLALPPLHEVMVFSLTLGLFFATPIFTLIFSRLLFEVPLPDALQPILMILVAPFSVGFSAYVTTTGHVDLFAEALYSVMLFLLAVLLGKLRKLSYCCPFRVSWWAVSFPLASSAIAAIRLAAVMPGLFYILIAWALLILSTVTIIALLVRTLAGIARGELKTLST